MPFTAADFPALHAAQSWVIPNCFCAAEFCHCGACGYCDGVSLNGKELCEDSLVGGVGFGAQNVRIKAVQTSHFN